MLFLGAVIHISMSDIAVISLCLYECVGLLSFMLISFYAMRHSAIRGSSIALMYNKIGDTICFILVGLCDLCSSYAWLDQIILTLLCSVYQLNL